MFYTEVKIMKALRKYKVQGTDSLFPNYVIMTIAIGFPRLYQFGSIDHELGYIAMELLGSNSLEELRRLESRK